MIAPLVPYGIRGAIWYQGESNANEASAWRYRRLFGAMIEDWRNRWGEGDFPFLFVQLANYHSNTYLARAARIADRDAATGQHRDGGDSRYRQTSNIHPTNKQDVGLRLALAARAIAYKQPIEYSGPMFQTATPENGAMRIYFSHADGMRSSSHEAITGFEIAGADGKYVAGEAKVDGNTIVVSSPQVGSPAAVRYAWADDPVCNLVNQAGLPASSFRSDQPHYQ